MRYSLRIFCSLPLVLLLLFILSGIGIIDLQAQEDTTQKRPFWGRIAGPPTSEVQVITVDSTGRIYAGTAGNGIQMSTNGGNTWTALNTGLTNLHVTSIEFDGNGTLFAGTWGGGIFRSTNQGQTWQEVNTGLNGRFIKTIKIKRPGLIFAGTYGWGVFRSTDNGSTWSAVNSYFFHMDVTAMVISSNGHIIAGTGGGGIYKSTDDGATWVRANAGLRHKYITSFVRNNLGELYCGTYGGGAHISVDGGSGWTQYSPPMEKNVTCITYYTDDQPVIGTNESGIIKYDQVWEAWRQSWMQVPGINAIARNSQGVLYAAIPKEGFYKSTDGGMNWSRLAFNDETGVFAIKAFKNGVVAGTSKGGGLFLSTNNGTSWNLAGFSGLAVYSIAFDSTGNIYAGLGNGLYRSADLGVTWTRYGLNDSVVKSVEINYQGYVYAGTSNFCRSTDDGATWTTPGGAMTSARSGIPFIGINYNGDIYVKSDTGLIKSTDNGNTWRIVIDRLNIVHSIAFNSNSHVFAATDSGLAKSTNNGNTWTKYDFGWEFPRASRVAITPRNHIYVAMRWENGVLHSSNNGLSWDTVNLGYNATYVNSLIISPDRYIFMGTASSLYRTVEPYDLQPPVLRTPTKMAFGVPVRPVFSWDPAPRADLYEIQVSADMDFNNIIEDAIIADNNYALHRTLSYNNSYSWRVRSKTNNSLGEWSPVYNFMTIVEAPKLISPENQSTGHTTKLSFKWHSVDGAASYIIQIAKDSMFTVIHINREVTDTTDVAASLEVYTKYFWRVRSKTSAGESSWSDIWSFRTKLRPAVLRTPANLSYGMPLATVYTWGPVEGAIGYRIQISKDKDFTNILFEGETDYDSTHTFNLSEYYTTYYWRIIPYDNNHKDGEPSEAWSYTTVIAPPALVLPEDLSYNHPLTVSLEWGTWSKATSYHVQVSTDPGFKTIFYEDTATTAFRATLPQLDYYTTYYWRVRMKLNKYIGLWSNAYRFTTKMDIPTLSYPENAKQEMPYTVYLKWNNVKGAVWYKVMVSKEAGFGNPIVSTDSVYAQELKISDLDSNARYFWKVKAINQFGESDWSETWEFSTKDPNSVEETVQNNPFELTAYPNPSAEEFNFEFSISVITGGKLEIIDSKGTLISSFAVYPASGSQNIKWNPSGIAPGVYFVNLVSGSVSSTIKVVYIR